MTGIVAGTVKGIGWSLGPEAPWAERLIWLGWLCGSFGNLNFGMGILVAIFSSASCPLQYGVHLAGRVFG